MTETERQNDDGLWKTADVATYLKVSTQTVRKLVERGEIPFRRLGPNTIRYDAETVREWAKGRAAA